MTNKITQLVNKAGDNLYPLAGGIMSDSVTTDMIQDGAVTSDKIDSATYSTTEQVVGTWVDGKPLYRRVWVVNTSSSTETWIADIPNIRPIRMEGYMYSETSSVCQPLGQWANPTDSSFSSRLFCDTTSFKAQVNTGWNKTTYHKIRAILWYTKTTD